jgi:hypothetical protein
MTLPAKYLKAVVISVAAFLLIIQVAVVVLNVNTALGGQADFLSSYEAGQLIRSGNGRALYAADRTLDTPNSQVAPVPFDRLAYEALLYVPLSLFSYRNA